jgi:hypothetical protein
MARLMVSHLCSDTSEQDTDCVVKGYLIAEPEAGFTRTLLLVHIIGIIHAHKPAIATSPRTVY